MSLKIFIGSSSNHEDSPIECIYEYTLRKNSKKDLDIIWMRQSYDKDSYWFNWDTSEWFTPFSGFRWGIAEACQFKGKALYTDVDMKNFRDISHLFNYNLDGKPFGMVWDSQQDNGKKGAKLGVPRGWWCDSVMLFDCEKAKPYMDSIKDMEEWSAKTSKSYKWEFGEKLNMPFKQESREYIEP